MIQNTLSKYLHQFSYSQLLRYVLTGGVAYLFEMSTILFLRTMGNSAVKSVAISFWVGLIVAFILQKAFAFKDYRKRTRVIFRQVGVYLILVAINYAFTIWFVAGTLGMGPYLSRTLALLITTIWNFFIYRAIFISKGDA